MERLRDASGASPGAATQQRHTLRGRWQRLLRAVRRNGVPYVFSYAFISNLNLAIMFGAAWALFLKTRGCCPVEPGAGLLRAVAITRAFYQPLLWRPEFLAFYGAICLGVGSLTRPARAGIAAAFLPLTRAVLRLYRDRLGCPLVLTYVLTILTGIACSSTVVAPAVMVSCAILSVPVMGV